MADKNLAKEERNQPLELNARPGDDMSALLALESRSWKNGSTQSTNGHQATPREHPAAPHGSDAGRGRSHAGQRRHAGRNAATASGARNAPRRRSRSR